MLADHGINIFSNFESDWTVMVTNGDDPNSDTETALIRDDRPETEIQKQATQVPTEELTKREHWLQHTGSY